VAVVAMSSSKSAKFTDTELQGLNIWTGLADFRGGHSEPIEPEAVPRTLTVEEIENMQQQAYAEAFQQGRLEGFEQGKTEGFDEGMKAGIESGSKQGYDDTVHLLQKRATELALLMETLRQPFQKLDESIETELVQLSISIASQVVRREIKHNPERIVEVIREAIKFLPSSNQKVTLTLHPDDAELVRSLLKFDESLPIWQLAENPDFVRGGCAVDTESSHIDATLERRIADVISTVLNGESG
jgi:flagellar assembly protein FliH